MRLNNKFRLASYKTGRNPRLVELRDYLESPTTFATVIGGKALPPKEAEREFRDMTGLRDQVDTLCTGYLAKILSPEDESLDLGKVAAGQVIYFRLQSLMSPEIVAILGRLVINHLSYLAGRAHRTKSESLRKIVPVYLDEFASFACPAFADLISKARSAGFALHFSHQSIGDLTGVAEGFPRSQGQCGHKDRVENKRP